MTISHWHKGELGHGLTCDVAVVGGGIIGCSTAYWLKKCMPDKRVALIEAETLGYGATGRNAGFLLQGAAVDYVTDIERYGERRAALLWDFTLENRRLIEAELGPDRIALQSGGSLILAGSTEENQRLRETALLLQQKGEQVEYWDGDAVRKEIRGAGFDGGLMISSGARLNSMKLIREIAGRSGAVILEGHPVHEVESHQGGCIIHTSRREIHTEQVVLCMNAFLPQLMPEIATYVRPVRAQMLATDAQPHWLNYPVYSHEGYYYIRQLDSGEILLGGARHLFVEEEVGYEDQTTPHLQEALLAYLAQHFSHLPAVSVRTRWSGVMGFTEDGLPIFAPLAGKSGCYWAAGFNGHGMGYGFRFGKLIAESLAAESSVLHPINARGSAGMQERDVAYQALFGMERFEK